LTVNYIKLYAPHTGMSHLKMSMSTLDCQKQERGGE